MYWSALSLKCFVTISQNIIFLCKRARPNIQTAFAFLCTWVQAPDLDHYQKWTWETKYLRGTWRLQLRGVHRGAVERFVCSAHNSLKFSTAPVLNPHKRVGATLVKGCNPQWLFLS
jgi:hypothetical protein